MDSSRIKEHMEVVGSDDRHVGTVDCVKDEKIVLTKSDTAAGGKHRAIPLDWVSSVEDRKVRLNQTCESAQTNWLDAEDQEKQSGSQAVCP